ncbi:MAG: hypothetical protein U0T82_01295 [Bacteroidales bacterium]
MKSLPAQLLDENDWFNIISGPQPRQLSSSWVRSDPASVLEALSSWTAGPVTNYSDLGNLLKKGYRYLSKARGNGSLVLTYQLQATWETGIQPICLWTS